MKITIDTRNAAKTIYVAGAMDAIGIHENGNALNDVVITANDDLTVDLRDVSFIDTSGLGLLVGALKRLRAEGRTLTITNIAGQPLDLFNRLNLNGAFSIAPKREISPAAEKAAMWTIDREAA